MVMFLLLLRCYYLHKNAVFDNLDGLNDNATEVYDNLDGLNDDDTEVYDNLDGFNDDDTEVGDNLDGLNDTEDEDKSPQCCAFGAGPDPTPECFLCLKSINFEFLLFSPTCVPLPQRCSCST